MTGVGNTKKADIRFVIGQGTMARALASQASLDDGIDGQFFGSQEEVKYGAVAMSPLLFQDDLLECSPGIIEARATNLCIERVLTEKRLVLNEDKTVCLVWGSSEEKDKVKKELNKKPLKCGEVTIKVAESDKWLGDYLNCGGLAESVMETIRQREGKVKGAAFEIVDFVDDWRARIVGGFVTGLFL